MISGTKIAMGKHSKSVIAIGNVGQRGVLESRKGLVNFGVYGRQLVHGGGYPTFIMPQGEAHRVLQSVKGE